VFRKRKDFYDLTPVEFTRTSMPEVYRLIRVLYRFINTD
jgi:hypothetical protein